MKIFDNVAQLKLARLGTGQLVKTKGYYTANDGGGAEYLIVATGTGTDDGGSYLDLALNQAELVDRDNVNVKQFGAKGDGVTDDTLAIQSAITSSPKVFVPVSSGNYVVSSGISVSSGKVIEFENTTPSTFHYSGTGACLTVLNRVRLINVSISGTGLNNPTVDNGQVGIYLDSADHVYIENPRIYNVGKGLSFYSLQTGIEGHYSTIYSPEIRYCYEGITTTESDTFTGEISIYGGRVSACFYGTFLDDNSGDMRFFGTAFEGYSGANYLVNITGGSSNAFFGCRFEAADAADPEVFIGANTSFTRFYGNYPFMQFDDFSETTLWDYDGTGLLNFPRRKDLSLASSKNLIDNGDLKGNLRGYSTTNCSWAFVSDGGYYGDGQTITPSAISGNIRIPNLFIGAANHDREYCVSITYKRNTAGQQVRLRVDTATGTDVNTRDSVSTGWTTRTVQVIVPASDTLINIYVYPDELIGADSIELSKISMNEGMFPIVEQAPIQSSSAPSSGEWRVGDIIHNTSPSASGFIGFVCVTSGTAGVDAVFKTFGAITA